MANTIGQTLTQAESDEYAQKDLFLTFHLNGENYGIEIGHVIEIVGVQKITEVPDMEDYLKGVVNMRGLVIPVMDVRLRFGMTERTSDERTCLIFVRYENHTVGLLVDRVNEVAQIPALHIEPAPAARDGKANFIKGMGKVDKSVNILLSVKELLTYGRSSTKDDLVDE